MGCKNGVKPNIVYTNGVVIKDGKILIYYGAADTYVCVAYADLDEFLNNLFESRKLVVEKKTMRTRKC